MRYATLRKFALSLPETTEEPHHHLASFRVRGKIFVTVPPGETHIHVFVSDAVREPALALYPEFIEKLWWGGKVTGLRVALGGARLTVVRDLVRQAWLEKAPAALAGTLQP